MSLFGGEDEEPKPKRNSRSRKRGGLRSDKGEIEKLGHRKRAKAESADEDESEPASKDKDESEESKTSEAQEAENPKQGRRKDSANSGESSATEKTKIETPTFRDAIRQKTINLKVTVAEDEAELPQRLISSEDPNWEGLLLKVDVICPLEWYRLTVIFSRKTWTWTLTTPVFVQIRHNYY